MDERKVKALEKIADRLGTIGNTLFWILIMAAIHNCHGGEAPKARDVRSLERKLDELHIDLDGIEGAIQDARRCPAQ